ncbi:MAG TPA: arsenate reductase ArsC, partial [Bacteroidota bacterium]|nr:arsenate reductase ArsC [Bacteroidota bacterium]
AVEAMKEAGIDISQKQTRDAFELYRRGERYAYVITVCDESSGERCPLFPGIAKRIHWSFEDPSALTGTHAEKLAKTIEIRNQIQRTIEHWIEEARPKRSVSHHR